VLSLLREQPMHGYQIIRELTARSGGVWRPSPGSIYPMLWHLRDDALVSVSEEDGRRIFSLTTTGRAEAERSGQDRRPPWEEISDGADSMVTTLHQRAAEVTAAAMQIAGAGSDQQVAGANRILTQARRDLYNLLGEGTGRQA
jgi:DNA-binding PadR family transcriptional regulator